MIKRIWELQAATRTADNAAATHAIVAKVLSFGRRVCRRFCDTPNVLMVGSGQAAGGLVKGRSSNPVFDMLIDVALNRLQEIQRQMPAGQPASGMCAQVASSHTTKPPPSACIPKLPSLARPFAMAANGR